MSEEYASFAELIKTVMREPLSPHPEIVHSPLIGHSNKPQLYDLNGKTERISQDDRSFDIASYVY